jgi:beta-phosphoglucomutase-like phosphatase (HAD superfamily)
MLKPPEGITALLFDLDGVITQTAKLRAAAWKEMFDDFLRERAEQTCEPFEEFTPSEDALAGVEAGRAGGFGRVVGVDRTGRGMPWPNGGRT